MPWYRSFYAIFCLAAALTAGAARPAAADCGEIVYVGNNFTSVDGGVSTSDRVSLYLPLSKCLKPNHTYKIGKVVGAGGSAEVGPQNSFFWDITQGQPGAKAKGSVTTDSSGLPASWSITFTQGTKRNTTLTIQTQKIPSTGTGDVAQGSSNGTTGYGFNSDDAGSWYAQ